MVNHSDYEVICMKPYKNLSGNSGVECYEDGDDYIFVKFKNKEVVYKYTHSTTGKDHVEKMKRLAFEGIGLAKYISQHKKELKFN